MTQKCPDPKECGSQENTDSTHEPDCGQPGWSDGIRPYDKPVGVAEKDHQHGAEVNQMLTQEVDRLGSPLGCEPVFPVGEVDTSPWSAENEGLDNDQKQWKHNHHDKHAANIPAAWHESVCNT